MMQCHNALFTAASENTRTCRLKKTEFDTFSLITLIIRKNNSQGETDCTYYCKISQLKKKMRISITKSFDLKRTSPFGKTFSIYVKYFLIQIDYTKFDSDRLYQILLKINVFIVNDQFWKRISKSSCLKPILYCLRNKSG